MNRVERWCTYEWTLMADVSGLGNPFIDVSLKASITGPDGVRTWDGFYDGDGVFKIRYMPQNVGEFSITTKSNLKALDGLTQQFSATPASEANHGPVEIDGMHFRHADQSRIFLIGTTAYVWHHRPDEVRQRTLQSFSDYGFNKIRMLFFPKHYTGNFGKIDVSYEPPCYPFEGEPKSFDFSRPNPAYFKQFEDRLDELMARDIIADVILFHPYDFGHWDIDDMGEDDELIYLRYIIARLASYRNVWWSLANEYDIYMNPDKKSMRIAYDRRDWDVIGEFIKSRDPSGHPISCHNIPFGRIYPDRPWMSHVSYQHPDTYTLLMKLKQDYKKPVINDEYQYEGNTPDDWGNSSAQLTLERHWRSAMAGGYATHGESIIHEDNNRDIFWAYGGDLTGDSPKRLAYLKQIMQSVPYEQMEWDYVNSDAQHYYSIKRGSDEYLVFMRDAIPNKSLWVGDWGSPERHTARYQATVYDVWNCQLVKQVVLPPSCRLPFSEWTVVHLKKMPPDTTC